MKIIRAEAKDWQEGADYFKKILLDATDLKAGNFLIQEIRMKSGVRAKIHHHDNQTELFYLINNNGYFIVNNENIRLEVGDILLVNVGEKHTVANESGEEFKFLAMKLSYDKDDTIID
ncbi:MAG: cupin domain-containing protein [Candidatus Kerfeldbacteria bacterium]